MRRRTLLEGLIAAHGTLIGAHLLGPALAVADEPLPQANVLLEQVLAHDPWGLSGAVIEAKVEVRDKAGKARHLAFVAKSRVHDAPFSKSLVRFVAPADLAGAGFLQVQNRGRDDDRHLFLPELKRSRRISGSLRSSAFMGTDFSFADLDRRDLREAQASYLGDGTIGKHPVHHLSVKPKRDDSPYGLIKLWVRKDNAVPLKMEMYKPSGVLHKRLLTKEVRRVSGHWFISKSTMENLQEEQVTRLELTNIKVQELPDDVFTVRELEKA